MGQVLVDRRRLRYHGATVVAGARRAAERTITAKQHTQRQQRAQTSEPHTSTQAVTHIRLDAPNAGKLTALDALAETSRALTQAAMRHNARAMNAYLRAANRALIPAQIASNASKRGVRATRVKSAYSSPPCHGCWDVGRANRPTQQDVLLSGVRAHSSG